MRLDIQFLRVLAVMAVVAAHYAPGFVPGGFVGVDIFFVISGYLMGSHLVRKVKETGNVGIFRFWLLRATRLFPQALLVVAVFVFVTVAFLPRRDWILHMPDAVASALFVQNWLLASEAQDYFLAVQETSGLQHYWSLAVEEQFYVALPLLMAVLLVVSRRRYLSWLLGASLLLALASVIYSQGLTFSDPVSAYYVTTSRVWELLVGVAVAALAAKRKILSSGASSAATITGLLAVALSIATFDASTPFPGIAALLPVLGTALVIWGGEASWLRRIGSPKPMQFLANHSYGIYLWHWPVLILFGQLLGRDASQFEKVFLFSTSVVLAFLSTRYVEHPIRSWGKMRVSSGKRKAPIAALAALSMAFVAAVPAAAYNTALSEQNRQLAEAQERYESLQTAEAEPSGPCVGPQELDPEINCVRSDDGFDFTPSLEAAKADDDNRKECWSSSNSERFNLCELGEIDNPKLEVFAVGDSHAAAMIGAFDLLGKELGWKITFGGKGGCFWTAAPLKKPESDNTKYCLDWRDKIQAHLDSSPPYDLILATNSARTARGVLDTEGVGFEVLAKQGLVDAWQTQIDRGVQIIAIKDNPFPIEDHLDCIEKAVTDPRVECQIETWDGFEAFDPIVAATDELADAHLIDLSQYYCDPEYCSPIVGGVLVYRDNSHVTGTWAKLLVPYMVQQAHHILEGLASPSEMR